MNHRFKSDRPGHGLNCPIKPNAIAPTLERKGRSHYPPTTVSFIMIARSILALILVALSAAPAYAERGSGRNVDPDMTGRGGVPHSYGSGSRVKPDRPVLSKGQGAYVDVFSCMIWEKQGSMPAADYAEFIGTGPELSQTLSELRSWKPASIWGCD